MNGLMHPLKRIVITEIVQMLSGFPAGNFLIDELNNHYFNLKTRLLLTGFKQIQLLFN